MMSKYVKILILCVSYIDSSDNKLTINTSSSGVTYHRTHRGACVSIPDDDIPVVTPTQEPVWRPVPESPSRCIYRIVDTLCHRARHNFDVIAHQAYEAIQDIAMGIEPPVHHESDSVLSVLREFNLILEDGSFNKELIRLYKNLNK